jgi:hypothetical protein
MTGASVPPDANLSKNSQNESLDLFKMCDTIHTWQEMIELPADRFIKNLLDSISPHRRVSCPMSG